MDDNERTVYVGNLDSQMTDAILYELFLQAGPVQYVTLPVDKSTKKPKAFGFVCFKDTESVPYAIYLLDNISLYGKRIRVQHRNNRTGLPPIYKVGIHSLDPDCGKEDYRCDINVLPHLDTQNTSLLGLPPQNASNMPQYGITNQNAPLIRLPLQFPGQPMNLHNQYNNYNGLHSSNQNFPFNNTSQSVDTGTLNNFKNDHDSRFSPYNQNRRNYRNQERNHGDSYNSYGDRDRRNNESSYQERRSHGNDRRSNLESRLVDKRHISNDRYGSPNSSRDNDHYRNRNNHSRSDSYNSSRRYDDRDRDRRY